MKELTVVVVDVPIWKWSVIIYQGGNTEQLACELKTLGLESAAPDNTISMGHAWVTTGCPVVLWVEDCRDVASLVHEVIHGVFGMLEARGLTYAHDSEEAYCYTVEYVLREALKNEWKPVRSENERSDSAVDQHMQERITFTADYETLKAREAAHCAAIERLTTERDQWRSVIVPEGGAFGPEFAKDLIAYASDALHRALQRAEAAEARLREVEADRDAL